MEQFAVESDALATLMHISGRLDNNSSRDCEQALLPVLEKERFLIVDFAQCPYVSSAGIRILLKAKKKLLGRHGELFLTGLSPEVFQVLEVAGLQRALRIERDPAAARQAISQMQGRNAEAQEWTVDGHTFVYQPSGNEKPPALLWQGNGIAGYNELACAVGFGEPAEAGREQPAVPSMFVTTGHCAAFLPTDSAQDADFRVSSDPARAGILVGEAVSFGNCPSGLMHMKEHGALSFRHLAEAAATLKQRLFANDPVLMLLVAVDRNSETPAISVAVLADQALAAMASANQCSDFLTRAPASAMPGLFGATFQLADMPAADPATPLAEVMSASLAIENITDVNPVAPDGILGSPVAWVFFATKQAAAASSRLIIETDPGLVLEAPTAFLVRRLYTDCAKVKIDPLHGGYSAQTFQVASFDPDGRKMRPTVLKVAPRHLIQRESDRCRQYALPYIFNNSAMVLGAEFYGETGALRYNFVGIGGEDSHLKWLTHYYQNSGLETLTPIFDKVFLQILKPWYGQAVAQTLFPFKDHDCTFTFFPFIFNVVQDQLSISSDDQFIYVEELARSLLNPYWFLKHEFPRQREKSIEYFCGVCHGDLNMQNILLDENMNVYLIDFSETRPRSVISDFARLEAIFLIEGAPIEDDADMTAYLKFIEAFYRPESLTTIPEIEYDGRHRARLEKTGGLARKMRQYACESVRGSPTLVPYYLALLEWIHPIVCFGQLSLRHKRLSMIVAGMLAEKITAANL